MFQAQTLTLASRMAAVLGQADGCRGPRRRAPQRSAPPSPPSTSTPTGDLPVRAAGRLRRSRSRSTWCLRTARSRTAARLAELVRERGDRLDTGFLSVPYLLDVLWDNGYPRARPPRAVAARDAVVALRGRPRRDDDLGGLGRDRTRRRRSARCRSTTTRSAASTTGCTAGWPASARPRRATAPP